MLESFSEMPLAIRFFLAFLVVLGMFGVFAWAVRRFGSGRLGGAGARGRQPRLAVIDHASVDARRRLILVRRDNVEHLIMIGGPTDVVVESTIVRGAPAPREATLPRPPALPEALPRALPLPDNSSANGAWPLQPEPIAPPRQAPRIEAMPEEPAAPPHAEPPPRPQQRETLAALADEIATRPVPPAQRGRPGGAARSRPAEPRAEPRMPAGRPAEAEPAANADQSLADMAQRLEAALRKPKSAAAPGAARSAPPPAQAADAEAAAPQPAAPPRAAPAPGKSGQSKTLYDSLEQEMASLLGRPAGKT